MFKKLSVTMIAMFMALGLVLTGCGNSSSSSSNGNGGSDKSSSTKSFGDQVDHTIIGIDPGAGLMKETNKAIKKYGLSNWTLQSGSGATMTASLAKAIKDHKPIVVTGWTPHWMFSKFDLKYLKDPKGVYGKAEEIHTVVHKGFKAKDPNAAKVLDQFYWTPADMGKVMLDIQNGSDPKAAAKKWINANKDKVSKWTKGAKKVSGKKITIAYVAWSSTVASTNVVSAVLENLGYKVTMQQLGAAGMWAAVAKGSAQVTLAAWLPTTHAAYYKKFKDQVNDLGPNLKGTKLGLVVPKYVKINSIEDLKK